MGVTYQKQSISLHPYAHLLDIKLLKKNTISKRKYEMKFTAAITSI